MKVKNPSLNGIVGAAETTLGVVAGAKLSNGASELIPLENKTYAKLAVAAVGLVAASAIEGKDTLGKLAKNACIGMAVQQGGELISETVQPMLPEPTGKGVNKFLHDSFGMNAPASMGRALGNPFTTDAFLRSPAMGLSETDEPVSEGGFATA
ncbi:hypothetical protein [Abyssalbus ytuae]|uniref:Uncharacterized protein n=1 Tax=Abyssalbus ytuae TaxID=2926907 RepID=A0A9E7D2W1_9FLAO|nr:hypothetical protein [Abyssalbus ytuae]UOB18593.1 hypothetical protein MQE35_04715 [Abyssalbus ytuae]